MAGTNCGSEIERKVLNLPAPSNAAAFSTLSSSTAHTPPIVFTAIE